MNAENFLGKHRPPSLEIHIKSYNANAHVPNKKHARGVFFRGIFGQQTHAKFPPNQPLLCLLCITQMNVNIFWLGIFCVN